MKHTIKIKDAFNRAQNLYDDHCHLQEYVGKKLLAFTKQYRAQADYLIDLGCGTGLITEKLAALYQYQDFHAIDIATALLAKARARLSAANILVYEADFNTLPQYNDKFDVVFSNMALHWSTCFDTTLHAILDFLSHQGTLAFSLPLKGSLSELTNHYALNDFLIPEYIIDQLHAANCSLDTYQIEEISLPFTDTLSALHSLKNTGANYVHKRAGTGLKGKSFLKRLDLRKLTYVIGYFVARKIY